MKKGFWSRIGSGIDTTRRFLINAVFVLMLCLGLLLFFASSGESIPEKAVLVLNPQGVVVEQLSSSSPLAKLDPAAKASETLLSDMIDAVERAAKDKRIKAMLIQLDDLAHIGLSKVHELRPSIEAFRATGKPVYALANNYQQAHYSLAVQADEIHVNPLGGVIIEGYSVYRNYFANALDKFNVKMHVFRVGEFKSAVEPFLRNDMSPSAAEANRVWLGQLWDSWLATIEARRGIEAPALETYANKIDEVMAQVAGNGAQAAVDAALVDYISTKHDLREKLIKAVGEADHGSFHQVNFRQYLSRSEKKKVELSEIALIVASGMILDGDQPPGTIGDANLVQLIRDVRLNDDFKALVLRIDSGGGSIFASENIRQELLRLKKAGKTYVASMGSVAASGGYWISADADEIWALPTTLTGSIGIFGAFPTLEKALDNLGINTDGVGTTDVAGGARLDRALNRRVENTLQSAVEFGYQRFIDVVAQGRDMQVEQVKELASGRVWTGADAHDKGLVDKLGGLREAVAAAAALAGVENKPPVLIEMPGDPLQLLLERFSPFIQTHVGSQLGAENSWLKQWYAAIAPIQRYSRLNDPRGIYALCEACLTP